MGAWVGFGGLVHLACCSRRLRALFYRVGFVVCFVSRERFKACFFFCVFFSIYTGEIPNIGSVVSSGDASSLFTTAASVCCCFCYCCGFCCGCSPISVEPLLFGVLAPWLFLFVHWWCRLSMTIRHTTIADRYSKNARMTTTPGGAPPPPAPFICFILSQQFFLVAVAALDFSRTRGFTAACALLTLPTTSHVPGALVGRRPRHLARSGDQTRFCVRRGRGPHAAGYAKRRQEGRAALGLQQGLRQLRPGWRAHPRVRWRRRRRVRVRAGERESRDFVDGERRAAAGVRAGGDDLERARDDI